MPTLPLYETPAHDDGWHRVVGPGGYEWWHLAASSDAVDGLELGVNLIEGDQQNPAYLRAYRRYRRRPTRVAPPVPRDYTCLRMALSDRDALLWELVAPQPPGTLRASTVATDVTLGPCALRGSEDGALRLTVGAPDASAPNPGTRRFDIDLTFRPLEPVPTGWVEVALHRSTAIYRRPTMDVRYDVSGTLRERNGAAVGRVIEFRGHGQYAHWFATGPLHH